MSTFQIFAIDPRKKVPEQLIYLNNCRELYASTMMAVRSLGPELPFGSEHLLHLKSAIAAIDFQVARLEGKTTEITKTLSRALSNCPNCSVKDRYSIIMLAAESGIKVDTFLDDLDKVGCLTPAQCEKESKIFPNAKILASRSSGRKIMTTYHTRDFLIIFTIIATFLS